MSTFFEKLTSASPSQPREEPLPSAKLKIAAESSAPPAVADPVSEDEGELTVDIYDKGDAIVIQSTVAGVRPDDLDIAIANDTVTIRGRRERGDEVNQEHYYYQELFWGPFSRSVILPEEIDDEKAEATIQHGLLTIHLPKRRKAGIQKLKVKVS